MTITARWPSSPGWVHSHRRYGKPSSRRQAETISPPARGPTSFGSGMAVMVRWWKAVRKSAADCRLRMCTM